MSEIIERVAKAMYVLAPLTDHGEDIPWEKLKSTSQDMWRSQARAAIAAMREPMEEMTESLDIVGEDQWLETSPAEAWRAMVDAALKC